MAGLNARDLCFSQGAGAGRWYMGGDPVETAFFSALSTTFPMGERFFIDSVRPFRADAPDALRGEIAGVRPAGGLPHARARRVQRAGRRRGLRHRGHLRPDRAGADTPAPPLDRPAARQTAEQKLKLAQEHCVEAQGYFFGEPRPVNALGEWLTRTDARAA